MDFPFTNPIPLDVMRGLEHRINWDDWYGRFGTATHVFSEYYDHNTVPEHLVGKATHVWLYIEK